MSDESLLHRRRAKDLSRFLNDMSDDIEFIRGQRDRLNVTASRMGEQADAWQAMAEDLWEELQLWHYDECPSQRITADGSPVDTGCTCHRILATKWNELTRATP